LSRERELIYDATRIYAMRPAQYVIVQENGRLELLRISLRAGKEEALPIFSLEERAREFLRACDLGPDWRVREFHNGELASLLLRLHNDVAWVLPNPLPKPLIAEDALLNLMDRGSFVNLLLAMGRDPQPG
jgi:hypothetical protein